MTVKPFARKRLCVCVCVCLCLIHTEYQNPHSTSREDIYGKQAHLSWSSGLPRSVSRLGLGFKVELRVGFWLRSGSGVGMVT